MEWRTIPGFPGYVINDDGDIINRTGYMLTRTGRKKDAYFLVHPDGKTAWARIPNLMRSALEAGTVVSTPQVPVSGKMPDECVPIPGLSPYCINREGNVWNSATKKTLIWQDKHNARSPYVTLFNRKKAVNMLLEITFGKGAAEAAGLSPWEPRACSTGDRDEASLSRESVTLRPKRRCHDCGRPTNDYRCSDCRAKWRRKYSDMEE